MKLTRAETEKWYEEHAAEVDAWYEEHTEHNPEWPPWRREWTITTTTDRTKMPWGFLTEVAEAILDLSALTANGDQIAKGGRKIKHLTLCEFGFAEEAIFVAQFADQGKEWVAGIGESMRPLQIVYKGPHARHAHSQFTKLFLEHATE